MAREMAPLPDMDEMVRNILAVYADASSIDRLIGAAWYAEANRIAQEIAKKHGVSIEAVAGVISALSPRVNWDINVRMARDAFATGKASGGLAGNCRKADAIMAGADPLDILGGEKTRAFYANIVNPLDAHIAVIDRHAFDVAMGRVTDDAQRAKVLGRKDGFEHIATAYRKAAAELGVRPSTVQAVTWVAWRNRA